ncbi:hypothetical protein C4D60_Mb09t10720 [Musa balbisiana]|uniref:Aldose 1-epimerase n=1 Tax=Musa balbisiana TaxID=52838 RepID=A0A4S8IGT0_MUSBA|nr:hypothetical protein C4D60_Mb09t10720 [Musa balbisiana]
MAAELYELRNGTITVKLTNFGATITSLLVPDANGDEFLTLFPSRSSSLPHKGLVFFSDVITRSWCFCSVLMGFRQARGCGAWFRYRRAVSSGKIGFDKVLWEVTEYNNNMFPSITFKYQSKDGDEGYPGDLSVTAKYSLPSSTSLKLEMEAVPLNKATPVNLAQHTYWNLAGHNSGNILDHSIQILASHLTPVDKNLIPTGEIMPVSGTCFDFTTEKKIGSRIHKLQVGYDHNYVLDSGEERPGLKHAAKVKDPSGSRVLDLWTDAPGMQFYTGNYVDGVVGKGGAVYGKHAALCLETQGFPNAINQPNFPSVVVQPGEKYKHTMLFELSTD